MHRSLLAHQACITYERRLRQIQEERAAGGDESALALLSPAPEGRPLHAESVHGIAAQDDLDKLQAESLDEQEARATTPAPSTAPRPPPPPALAVAPAPQGRP